MILTLLLCSVGASPSIQSYTTGQVTPLMEGRSDFQKYSSANRILENMLVYPQGPAFRRPGTRYITEQGPATFSEVYGEYKMTYISENSVIWGIPVTDTILLTLDASAARNVGGGVVAIPCTGHPFVTGRTIRFSGTSNYDYTYTLLSGTTDSDELFITKVFSAETFAGTETAVEVIVVSTSMGRMVQDSNGILYYGFNNGVGKIAVDGTKDEDFLSPSGGWTGGKSNRGLVLSSDGAYLYVYVGDDYTLYKFDLSDGSEVWQVTTSNIASGYDIDVDSSDNVYICNSGHTSVLATIYDCAKFAAADGTKTMLSLMGEGKETWVAGGCPYVTHVDNDMGIVIVAGKQFCSTGYDESVLYNLATRTFDNSSGSQVALGGTYTTVLDYTYNIGSDCVVTHNNYIYVLNGINNQDGTDYDHKIYKLDSSLNTITSIDAPTYACGLYVDLWQNIVVVAQDWADSRQSDVLWFYDLDLNYITSAGGFYNQMLKTWDAAVGGAYQQGNAAFYPGIVTISTEFFIEAGADTALRLIPFEHSPDIAHVLSLGDKYLGFYRTIE